MDIVTYELLAKSKLSSNQGSNNAGKYLGVNSSGKVVPIIVAGSGLVMTENLIEGEDYSILFSEDSPSGVDSVAGRTGVVTLTSEDVGLPAAPTNNGTFHLQVVVASGNATYSWVADN